MYQTKNCLFLCGLLLSLLSLPGLFVSAAGAPVRMPSDWPGGWSLIGRTKIQANTNSVIVEGGYAVNDKELKDAEISFCARAPMGTEQVQIWAGFRFRDRDSQYVFALRGGNN